MGLIPGLREIRSNGGKGLADINTCITYMPPLSVNIFMDSSRMVKYSFVF